jgi:hypothetical protein
MKALLPLLFLLSSFVFASLSSAPSDPANERTPAVNKDFRDKEGYYVLSLVDEIDYTLEGDQSCKDCITDKMMPILMDDVKCRRVTFAISSVFIVTFLIGVFLYMFFNNLLPVQQDGS